VTVALEQAKQYIRKVGNDNVLAAKLKGLKLGELVDHAGTVGYEFSLSELQEALDELHGDLSADDLSGAVGGVFFGPSQRPQDR
jgi:predicted ribosomally synthesized peptide with nif11-like leader